MSSAKVSSTSSLKRSTSVMKFNDIRTASLSSVSSSISAIADSTHISSSTEQYLKGGQDPLEETSEKKNEENTAFLHYSVLEYETSPEITFSSHEEQNPATSRYDMEKQIETYERTVEESENSLKKKTQGFG